MLDGNAETIEKAVLATLSPDRRPTEAEVSELASTFRRVLPIGDDEFAALRRRLHSKLSITMEQGTALRDEAYAPWLSAAKSEIDPFYWERYRAYLISRERWPPLVVNTLDRVADDVLDLTGDPGRHGVWKRRGLVVGDVQSGKTGTYTALCCKAADAGFRFIILLTGTLENLRRQTQERLDEGFVGLDSSQKLLPGVRRSLLVGVGTLDGNRTAGVFTSRSRDFSQQLLTQLGFRLSSFSEPVLVVVKKNKRILENLETWLRGYNAALDGTINSPVLVIDDEADSASINTNVETNTPTAINQQIRKLLKLFTRSAYVGFTATPFANVFINPDTEDQLFDDDLFPRDFIYALEAPTNYLGPHSFFGEFEDAFLRRIDDADQIFPARHKSSYEVPELPWTLTQAVYSFVLCNAIRDLRRHHATHRSMLVNVSRFTYVQNQVAALIDDELKRIQRDVRSFSKLPEEEGFSESKTLKSLFDLWQRDFYHTGIKWPDIQDALNAAIQPIVVKAINQSTGSSSLDYSGNKESGLRVIAVGGNSLSRGLTLEGLSTSYFFRNSQMYDTLQQMGRWFGYRDGYNDLCRLWITDEAADWYRHISVASDELRAEFKRMRDQSLTPRDFGLKVRAHPDSLIVTARNKMRSSGIIERHISLSGEGLEAARLRSSPAVLDANYAAAEYFIHVVRQGSEMAEVPRRASAMWEGVPKATVAQFLAQFQAHQLNFDFQVDRIADFLNRTNEERLQRWTVAIPRGGDASLAEQFAGIDVVPLRRQILRKPEINAFFVSRTKVRVGAGGTERLGLSKAELERVATDPRIQEQYKGRQIPDSEYRAVRMTPLLLLYLIRGEDKEGALLSDRPPLVSIGLSFPRFDDSSIRERALYRANLIELRAFFEAEADDDEVEDDNGD